MTWATGARGSFIIKAAAAGGLIALGELLFDGSAIGAVLGVFAAAWLGMLLATRPIVLRNKAACIAALSAVLFAAVLFDDPSLCAWFLFWTALSLAALLPRQRFDDALGWASRLGWHALVGVAAPFRDGARLSAARLRFGRRDGRWQARAIMVGVPLVGGALFVALFAGANPLIEAAFEQLRQPDIGTIAWRTMFGFAILIAVWVSLRPRLRPIFRFFDHPGEAEAGRRPAFDLDAPTLILSLATFNAIFAVENGLDIAFLWSGAALPAGVTMADYAHRGAYSLIVTALLAGLFVLVLLRPGGRAAARPAIRWLVTIWIAQNLLLVASSMLRTLDYVDAYSMTVLRLAALAWMALVAVGLALICWRLLRGRSAAWLINANAVAAALLLACASIVDLGAVAAAWNVRVALARGTKADLDLCYLDRLGSSALTSLALLESRGRDPERRDRAAYLRWQTQSWMVEKQANWRSWTWRDARRLAAVRAMMGSVAPKLRAAPDGRDDCDGSVLAPAPPPPVTPPTPQPAAELAAPIAPPTPLTDEPQR